MSPRFCLYVYMLCVDEQQCHLNKTKKRSKVKETRTEVRLARIDRRDGDIAWERARRSTDQMDVGVHTGFRSDEFIDFWRHFQR